MEILLKNKEYIEAIMLPANQFELKNVLEKLRVYDDRTEIHAVIRGKSAVPELTRKRMTADIYKLNLLADRLENAVCPDIYAMRALVKTGSEFDVDELILMTYGLDSVSVCPCSNTYELGEFATQNELLPELEECSDEILELIDAQKVGEIVQERENGVFIDGFYCIPSSYEPPDIQIEIGRPESCFFQVLVAPAPKNDEPTEHLAQWISLPQSREYLNKLAKEMGENSIKDCVFYDFQSILPTLEFDDMRKINMLNDLALQLENLSSHEFVKLKAVMHSEKSNTIESSMVEIELLDSYEFDNKICDYDDFARVYLKRNLPEDFDISVMNETNLEDFGRDILDKKHGVVTPYGVVSGRDFGLHEPIMSQSEMELTQDSNEMSEDFEEEFTEDLEMGFGGMSL